MCFTGYTENYVAKNIFDVHILIKEYDCCKDIIPLYSIAVVIKKCLNFIIDLLSILFKSNILLLN